MRRKIGVMLLVLGGLIMAGWLIPGARDVLAAGIQFLDPGGGGDGKP